MGLLIEEINERAKIEAEAKAIVEDAQLQPGTRVRVGHESKTTIDSDIPARYRGRSGEVVKFFDQYPGEPPLYAVRMPDRKKPLILYIDEFTVE